MSNLIKNGIIQTKDIYGVKFEVDLIPETNKYRRLNSNTKKEWITNHNTGNNRLGADEKMHTEYVDREIGYINWHLTLGENKIYQELPLHEAAYHAGDGGNGKGNLYSIGIEICEVGNWDKIRENALKLNAFLFNNVDTLINDNWHKTIVPHQKWNGKYCPRIILSEKGGFKKFQDDGFELMKKYKNQKIEPTTPTIIGIDFKKLEKIIKQNLDDNYWIKNLMDGTLTRFDVIFIINKLAGEININKALDKFEKNGWTNNKKYWLNVANGEQRYSRVFLNSLINNVLKTL